MNRDKCQVVEGKEMILRLVGLPVFDDVVICLMNPTSSSNRFNREKEENLGFGDQVMRNVI